MGLFKRKTRFDIRIRRGILKVFIPASKAAHASPNETPTTTTNNEKIHGASKDPDAKLPNFPDKNESVVSAPDVKISPETPIGDSSRKEASILQLPAELLRDIFSYLDSVEIQSLHDTHPYFRAIVVEHRSFICRELASRNLRYFARYLKPIYFDLQRESRARFLPQAAKDDGSSINCLAGPGENGIPAWYLTLCNLDRVTQELYSLMPRDENEWETDYLEAQGLTPSQYNPRVWPRPGNPSFYFTHTIISFYQYNTLIRIPKESLVEFRSRDIKPVCRCAQGYFRSTAHLGILCAVYKACVGWKEKGQGGSARVFKTFVAGERGGLGNHIYGTRVSVKELFKMVVVVTHPANLLEVIKRPTDKTMARLDIVLEILTEVLAGNEQERRQSGVDRTYTKGLEMMEGFARHWEDKAAGERRMLRYFDDWQLMSD
ncbi:hypothetical protein H072_5815 [Dactylellina haptotyla CBS 200.50]|uniref:F-box domain-containing protein n=1 Tax=Dactylellina haptotyla (strain CBS 200.50) TaxID=1284197 RepID=S8ABP5_DACHA|nr:hypothetical protein H072_5815 [Dactylellina haptotyla CBS 200.50]